MKPSIRARVFAFLVTATTVVALTVPQEAAEAWYTHKLSDRQTLVFLTPWETKYLSEALSSGRSKAICAPSLLNPLLQSVIKVMNRICSGYSLANKVLYWRVRWFLKQAAAWGGCGAFIIHRGITGRISFRSPTAWNHVSGKWGTHVWTLPGKVDHFKTPDGWKSIQCNEYRYPHLQSPVRPPRPTTATG